MKRRASGVLPALDLSRVRTYPLRTRRSKVAKQFLATPPRKGMSLAGWLAGLPDILAARDFRVVVQAIASRHRAGKRVVMGMGAHPIKVGLSPLIIDFMERGILSAVAVNGASLVHDFEMAYAGETSEDVAANLADGQFGMVEETGRFLNNAIGASGPEQGLGEAVGSWLGDPVTR